MKDSKNSIGVTVIVAAAVVLLVGALIDPVILSRTAIAAAQEDVDNPYDTTAISGGGGNAPTAITRESFQPISNIGIGTNAQQHRVAVGGGNLTMSINQFSPSTIQIQPGESVTFYAPSGSTELHNVVLDVSNGTALSSLELGFILPSGFSSQALQLAPPDNYGEPIIQNMSDGRQSIVALNKVLFNPSVVDQNGDASYLQEQQLMQQMEQAAQQGLSLPPPLSANYTMQGTEVVVSSGLILDVNGLGALGQEQGQQQPQQQGEAEAQQQQPQQQQVPTPQGVEESLPPAYPILSNFTVTFNEPGAYPFLCAFHPGMTGVVNVVEANATQSQNGTEISPA